MSYIYIYIHTHTHTQSQCKLIACHSCVPTYVGEIRLCLFWVKITSGNAFPYLRVLGCARKMHFPEMVFSWSCVGCKLISVFILPSNTIFRKIERERELSESEIEEEERGREHTPPASQAPAREIAPRKRSNPDFAVAVWRRRSTSPFNFAVRRRRSTSPSRRSRSQSQHRFVIPDREPRFVVPNRDRRTPKPIVLLFLLLSIWPDYDFFFLLGFICVSELRDEIIYLFGRWENVFSVWFWFLLL